MLFRQTEWMSVVLSKIAAGTEVDVEIEQKLDDLRKTVGVVQHPGVFHICSLAPMSISFDLFIDC